MQAMSTFMVLLKQHSCACGADVSWGACRLLNAQDQRQRSLTADWRGAIWLMVVAKLQARCLLCPTLHLDPDCHGPDVLCILSGACWDVTSEPCFGGEKLPFCGASLHSGTCMSVAFLL